MYGCCLIFHHLGEQMCSVEFRFGFLERTKMGVEKPA